MPNSLPTGTKITSYTWSFDGATAPNPIKNWDGNGTAPDGTPQQLFPLTAADLTGTDTSGNGISVSPVSFYDQVADNVMVKCAVGLKFSDSTTATVTAKSMPVAFLKPTADWGVTQLTVADDPDNSSFQAGELLGPISITVPSSFSGGYGCLAQLRTFDRSVKRHPLKGKPDTYYYKVQKTNPDGTTSDEWKTVGGVTTGQVTDASTPPQWSIVLQASDQYYP